MECSELIGVDTAEGVAEKDGSLEAKMGKERRKITKVVSACIGWRVTGKSMSSLIQCDNTPPRR